MTIDDELDLLQRSPVFANMPANRLRLLVLSSDYVTFAPGAIISQAGEPSETVYFILSGRFAVAQSDFELRYVVGVVGALLQRPYLATIRAETEVRALRVSRQTLLDLIAQCPHMALALLTELARIIALLAPPPADGVPA